MLIDPAFIADQCYGYVNQHTQHNTVKTIGYHNNVISDIWDIDGVPKSGTLKDTRAFGFSHEMYFDKNGEDTDNKITRSIDVYNTKGRVYYMVNDKLEIEEEDLAGLEIHINGNGGTYDGETSFDHDDRKYTWNHPCDKGRNTWGVLTHIASVTKDDELDLNVYQNASDGTHHGAGNNRVTDIKDIGYDASTNDDGLWAYFSGEIETNPVGIHSRMEVSQEAMATRFQTLLLPYRCNDPKIPVIHPFETEDYVGTQLAFGNPTDTALIIPGRSKMSLPPPNNYVLDTILDFHLARLLSGTTVVTNPFMLDSCSSELESDAERVFMSRGRFVLERPGACDISIIAFKQAEIQSGQVLEYDDTVYISSTDIGSIRYQHDDKFVYSGYVSSVSGTTVTFFLPDLQRFFPMKGFREPEHVGLLTTHNSSSVSDYKYVTITFPAGLVKFRIQLAEPCLADCYFPPTSITIDTLFDFDLSLQKPLDHDLDIVSGGHLRITEMSRMSICPDNVLVNKDSLTMTMDCNILNMWLVNEDGTKTYLPEDTLKYICDRNILLADRAVNTTRNLILVNDKAGLVLDSGSVTHIGTNSTILIRPGGTLLVKAGATVIIGDSTCVENRGELLADHGSYVCIEEGANMFFYNEIDSFNFYYKDTLDRHIVYIAMPDSNNSGGAIAGKNPLGGRGKFTGTIDAPGIWSGGSCVPFCDLIEKNPLYGVNNRQFGWFNIAYHVRYSFRMIHYASVNRLSSMEGHP